jgi:hypothetical protein
MGSFVDNPKMTHASLEVVFTWGFFSHVLDLVFHLVVRTLVIGAISLVSTNVPLCSDPQYWTALHPPHFEMLYDGRHTTQLGKSGFAVTMARYVVLLPE